VSNRTAGGNVQISGSLIIFTVYHDNNIQKPIFVQSSSALLEDFGVFKYILIYVNI